MALTHLGSLPTFTTDDGAWLSPVEHLLWEQGVAGSNPAAPTNKIKGLRHYRRSPLLRECAPFVRHLGEIRAI